MGVGLFREEEKKKAHYSSTKAVILRRMKILVHLHLAAAVHVSAETNIQSTKIFVAMLRAAAQ